MDHFVVPLMCLRKFQSFVLCLARICKGFTKNGRTEGREEGRKKTGRKEMPREKEGRIEREKGGKKERRDIPL